MTTWTDDELDALGDAAEMEMSSARNDGTLRRAVPIWVVRVDDDLYVRSYRGEDGAWYRNVLRRHEGHVRANGIECDVAVEEVGDDVNAEVDAAYHSKYARYGDTYVERMTAPGSRVTTLRLLPR